VIAHAALYLPIAFGRVASPSRIRWYHRHRQRQDASYRPHPAPTPRHRPQDRTLVVHGRIGFTLATISTFPLRLYSFSGASIRIGVAAGPLQDPIPIYPEHDPKTSCVPLLRHCKKHRRDYLHSR
jgi:hypothetical protein